MGSLNSFYGGPIGLSFSIAYIFGSRAELLEDLALGWFSSIHVGEFVIISYGRFNLPEYASNLAKDNGVSWNSTLWQKTYNESQMGLNDAQNPNGFAYRWIASMVGNTPVLTMLAPDKNDLPTDSDILVLEPDEKPVAWIDNSNADNPILYMALPRSLNIKLVQVELIPYTDPPRAEITSNLGNSSEVLKLWLPENHVDALKIIKSFNQNSNPPVPNIENDSDASIGAAYIKSLMGPYTYKQDELFSLTYDNVTYWYYCVDPLNDKWGRAQLTGNVINIMNEIDKTASLAWSVLIKASDWAPDGNKYSYTLPINGLTCGRAGDVPPIIVHTSNLEEYSEIESAQATPGGTIKFTIPNIPQNTIGLVIIDNR